MIIPTCTSKYGTQNSGDDHKILAVLGKALNFLCAILALVTFRSDHLQIRVSTFLRALDILQL